MPNRPVRSFLAILAVLGSVLPGLAGAGASAAEGEPALPTGGCWRYVPGPGEEIDDVAGMTDISLELEPWAEDPALTLTTAGDSLVGGERTFSLDLSGGPAVPPQLADLEGSATFLFDVIDSDDQRLELDPVEVDFVVPAGDDAIGPIEATGSFELTSVGTSTLVLRAVFFDLPAITQRLACNGQLAGDSTVNPATTPLDTSILAEFLSVAATTLGVTAVSNQDVVDAARPGDEVELALVGLASSVPATAAFCGPSTGSVATCGPTAPITTSPDGTAATTLVVPTNAVVGAGAIRVRSQVSTGEVVLDQPMRVLGKPTVQLGSSSATDRLSISGAEWDPLRQVKVTTLDDAGDRVGDVVDVAAKSDGRIQATFARDENAVVVVAAQSHGDTKLEARVDVPIGSTGSEDDDDDDAGGNDGGTTTPAATANNAVVAAPAVAPLDIPLPQDLAVTTVPGAAAGDGALAVTEVELVGSTDVGDLFGAGPQRTLKFRVENISSNEVVTPGLTIGVGKGKDADPIYASDGFAQLAPGESTLLEIPIGLPTGAMGTYTITGQIGSGQTGIFTVSWETYPWGLFGLNALGVLLLAVAIRRRLHVPAPTPSPGASAHDAGDAVIDLDVLERWWGLEADSADTMADAVVDVAAVERWLERRSARNAEIG